MNMKRRDRREFRYFLSRRPRPLPGAGGQAVRVSGEPASARNPLDTPQTSA